MLLKKQKFDGAHFPEVWDVAIDAIPPLLKKDFSRRGKSQHKLKPKFHLRPYKKSWV